MDANGDNEDRIPLKIVFKMSKVQTNDGVKEKWIVDTPHKKKRKHKSKSHRKKRHSSQRTETTSPLPNTEPPPTPPKSTGKRKENPNIESPIEPPPKRIKRVRTPATPHSPVQSSPQLTSPTNGTTPSTQKKKRTKKSKSSQTTGRRKPMPLYKVISNMIKQLIQQDQHSIFYDRVTDDIAPGYSSVIKHPMCFLQMREKLTKRLYKNLEAAQMDFKLIFTNAMKYNTPDTIYYNEAKRVLDEAKKLTKNYKEKLDPSEWGNSDPLFSDVTPVPIAIDPDDVVRKEERQRKRESIPPKVQEKATPVSNTPRSRIRTPRKRKKDSIANVSKQSTPLQKSTPSLLSPAIQVTVPDPSAIPVIKVEPSKEVRRFVSISRGLIPSQQLEPNPSKGTHENIYNMFTERLDDEAWLPSCGYPNIVSNTFLPTPSPIKTTIQQCEVDHGVDPCISNLSSEMKTKLRSFFDVLENSPEDIPSFRLEDTQLSEQLLCAMDNVEPLDTLNQGDLESIRALEQYGISMKFLDSTDTEISGTPVQELLEKNSSLITTLFEKQKSRLDHEPSQEEHIIAQSVADTLVATCSYSKPLELASQRAIYNTRKRLQNQIQQTLNK